MNITNQDIANVLRNNGYNVFIDQITLNNTNVVEAVIIRWVVMTKENTIAIKVVNNKCQVFYRTLAAEPYNYIWCPKLVDLPKRVTKLINQLDKFIHVTGLALFNHLSGINRTTIAHSIRVSAFQTNITILPDANTAPYTITVDEYPGKYLVLSHNTNYGVETKVIKTIANIDTFLMVCDDLNPSIPTPLTIWLNALKSVGGHYSRQSVNVWNIEVDDRKYKLTTK